MVLYLCHRALGNSWAEIARFLEGRTDNTIKNHWNSCMRKRVGTFKNDLELQAKEHCKAQKLDFMGISVEGSKVPQYYKQFMKKLEE